MILLLEALALGEVERPEIFSTLDPPRIADTRERGDRHGYRAVHVILRAAGVPIEIQIRSAVQQQWAQLVERVDQHFGWDLKHGLGPRPWLAWLYTLSGLFRRVELGEDIDVGGFPPPPHPLT